MEMSLYGSNVEYGLHCLLYLVDPPAGASISSKDLAEFQGVSPSLVAKLFTQLQKAGIVESAEGIRGGYRLAKPAGDISVFDVVRAVDGDKPLFQCREIRANCVLYGDDPPASATKGLCSIHAVMLEAQERMYGALREQTLASLAGKVDDKTTATYSRLKQQWFEDRDAKRRTPARLRSTSNTAHLRARPKRKA
jgi:Rrf2 family protein